MRPILMGRRGGVVLRRLRCRDALYDAGIAGAGYVSNFHLGRGNHPNGGEPCSIPPPQREKVERGQNVGEQDDRNQNLRDQSEDHDRRDRTDREEDPMRLVLGVTDGSSDHSEEQGAEDDLHRSGQNGDPTQVFSDRR